MGLPDRFLLVEGADWPYGYRCTGRDPETFLPVMERIENVEIDEAKWPDYVIASDLHIEKHKILVEKHGAKLSDEMDAEVRVSWQHAYVRMYLGATSGA